MKENFLLNKRVLQFSKHLIVISRAQCRCGCKYSSSCSAFTDADTDFRSTLSRELERWRHSSFGQEALSSEIILCIKTCQKHSTLGNCRGCKSWGSWAVNRLSKCCSNLLERLRRCVTNPSFGRNVCTRICANKNPSMVVHCFTIYPLQPHLAENMYKII